MQFRLLVGLGQQGRQQLGQAPHATVTLVLQIELKATGLAQTLNRWWRKSQGQAFLDATGLHIGFHHDLLGRLVALVPGLEREEHRGSRRLQATATEEVQTDQAEHGVDVFVRCHCRFHFLHHLVGAFQRRSFWQDHGANVVALVFVRHQGAGNDFEQNTGQHAHGQEQGNTQHAALQEEGNARGVVAGQVVEAAVEPIEEGIFALHIGLQEHRAQGRCQGQRNHAGQHHGNRDGDRELAVQLTRQTAQECHGNEGRAQHQHNRDHRAGHFAHGLDGSVHRRHVFFVHQALNVFQHHNRVIHHDTNRQHHAEQRQRVNAVAQQMQAGHGANQGHRNRQGWNDGGAPALQKQIHHDENQHHGLQQRLHHFVNRLHHKRCRVIRRAVGHGSRELGFQLLQRGFYGCAGVQCVGTGLQENPHRHCRVAIHAAIKVVVFGAQLHTRHIFEAYHRAFVATAHHNAVKLLGLQQTAFGRYGKRQLFAVIGWRTNLAGGVLGILLRNGI